MDARLKTVIGYGFVPTVTQMDRYLRLATGGKVARNPRLIDDLLTCRRYAAIVEGWQAQAAEADADEAPPAQQAPWTASQPPAARAQVQVRRPPAA